MTNACPLCRALARTTLYRGTRSGDVHRCTACGMVYSDPRGQPVPGGPPAFTDCPEAYLVNAKHRLSLLARATGITGGKLLDVGCYDGPFILAAAKLGFEVTGIEPNAIGAAAARARGLEVIEAPFEAVELSGTFRVITMIHTVEHLPDPLAALQHARRLLPVDGALLIEAPNFDAWSRRLMGRRWRQFIADHFQFFEPETLRRTLQRAGFEVPFLQPVGKTASWQLLADRVGRYYSRGGGEALAKLSARFNLGDREFSINLGDILLAVATPRADR